MITMNPYLNFAGNSREAMTFYHGIFGGDLQISTFADFGMTNMPADGTMHAALRTPTFSIMASDAMAGAADTWKGSRNYISLMGAAADAETLTSWFHGLAEGGNVGQALEVQVWGGTYGQLTDKFGIEWMMNIDPA